MADTAAPVLAGPEIISMGCRLNIAEGEAMRALLAGRDDVVVINSCAVTNEAVRQTRQAIRKARKARPDAQVVVTGCAAQTDPAMFAAMPEVDRVLGNVEKLEATAFTVPGPFVPSEVEGPRNNRSDIRPSTSLGTNGGVSEFGREKVQVSDIMAVRQTAPHLVTSFAEHARAFVEVQNGCDHRCTFCIIPYGRGNSRSVPAGAVVDAVRALVERGYAEVVLTGVDVTSYGPDLPGSPSLGLLVERVLKLVPELKRLRLSSLDGVEVDDRLFELITGEPRVMPHVHLSLQSGDDMILKRMKRRHSRAQAIALVERMKARRPEIAIGADLIAGFPTEDEAMHANNLSILEACDVVHGHIFPFSPRAGTPAARMPQLDRALVKARAAEMRAAAQARAARWRASLVGTRQNLLVERDGRTGHAENFVRIALPAPDPSHIGRIVPVAITGQSGDMLTAEIET
ncbi:MAG: tRNA (N(6)-L-threonylcarbamoyladenosine(37)-C(2))-methylthiotransferase MtaB [Sphingomonadales bacterium RIFCSPHIGHO2_01_FULL_65_20]|uniref:tRNA (N(6)-L-threonylcarbamoyladenosine(37)-C(2))- methylthiotransferase MtaB n=1 Tax=Blastomonas sp. TaxID=1909299 RepID=UPI0008C14435|nr:tRNA (N(6)-L-threonylcarbamoyladenosine(37)-C(2))-methylthiotransferase MtaB [Blastomonas sp.]MCH2236406.1 tRNA (N(6)-L-threonylcarbamoyladenosine(37)-C(2))-methylthiotransferase MtaB [Blastomonas sp.]OHC94617.1 MAG: tRNA (N(6)-L-threonylcarbamoyladenosine(37)-C(2))-methylthiotransferase MtaB [Sphingomonadales bacterium RIFCSPHIGHO2_01_FULL_65_20]